MPTNAAIHCFCLEVEPDQDDGQGPAREARGDEPGAKWIGWGRIPDGGDGEQNKRENHENRGKHSTVHKGLIYMSPFPLKCGRFVLNRLPKSRRASPACSVQRMLLVFPSRLLKPPLGRDGSCVNSSCQGVRTDEMGSNPTCILHHSMLHWNRQGVTNCIFPRQFALKTSCIRAPRHGF